MNKLDSIKQILALFIVLSLLLGTTAFFLFYSLGQSMIHHDLMAREITKLGLLSDIRGTAGYMQISVLRYALTDDAGEMDDQAASFHDYYLQNGQRFEQLRDYLETGNERKLFEQAVQARLNYGENFSRFLSLNLQSPEEKLAFNAAMVRPAFDDLTDNFAGFSNEISETARTNLAWVQSRISLFQRIGAALAALAVIFIIALAILTLNIIGRLREDRDNLEKEAQWRKQAMVDLEISNKELESFAYSVSHDLRTPLRSLDGFSEALLEDYQDKIGEQGRHYLRRIQDASILMGRLIDDILKLSRITRSEMSHERVNLSEVAAAVIADLRKNEPGRQVEVAVQPNLIVRGDARLLRIMLENLIGNAWKFTGKSLSPRIEVGSIRHDGTRAYYIRDNGAGFDMNFAGKLFQPFQRLHRNTDYPGTGVGLATVQRIARRHGGKAWAEGKEGEGATFYFTLGQA